MLHLDGFMRNSEHIVPRRAHIVPRRAHIVTEKEHIIRCKNKLFQLNIMDVYINV